MTLQQRVSAFVSERAPRPVCDECVADHLVLNRRQVSGVGPWLSEMGTFSVSLAAAPAAAPHGE